MEKWIITGISGCGRIEKLNEIKSIGETMGKKICVHDVGDLIFNECKKRNIPISDNRILDMDQNQLKLLRTLAIKTVENEILKSKDIDLHLIGTHATFRWKNRLIPGISYQDVLDIKPNGFMNIVQNVQEIFTCNKKNPKWEDQNLPDIDETQNWLMEEEFVTEVLSSVMNVPMYIVARDHKNQNLLDLFFTTKKKIYLSYPITAVRDSAPELLDKIQGSILTELEKLFIVFNPLTIKDISFANKLDDMPELLHQLTHKSKEMLKTRTIERDFQFIDQSDAVVVFYLTDKVSPGVLAEIFYAHRNQKPVFMVYQEKTSPFIEDVTTCIVNNLDEVMEKLKIFAEST